jgi:tetratricopeptide (TPR) repeat protein
MLESFSEVPADGSLMRNMKTETREKSKPAQETADVTGVKGLLLSGTGRWIAAVLVALVTFVVFLPALNNGFVNYDDGIFVYENKHITSISTDFIKWAFTNREYQWSPVRWSSHAVDYWIWRLNPSGHHLSSIILHSLNAFLVVVLVFKLLELARLKMQPPPDRDEEVNFRRKALIAGVVTGLLFGIHPLRVESVAWISERKDVLYAFFFLLSLISYLNYAAFSVVKRKRLYYLLALVFFIISVMSKATAVALPLVLLLLDIYPLQRINFHPPFSNWRRVLVEKLPFFVIAGAVTLINIGVHEDIGVLVPLLKLSLTDRVMLAAKTIAFYLGKTVWPFNLALIYGEPDKVSFSVFEYIALIFFMAAVTAACIFLWRRGKRLWLSVWIYYVLMLLPVSVIKVFSFSFAHDRYTYMPDLGPFLLAGLGVAFLMARMEGKKKAVFGSLLVAVFSVFAVLTVKQTAVWKNSVTLWSSVIERTPGFVRAYYDRGTTYLMLARYREAIKDLGHVIEMKPFQEAYINRGQAYKALGDYQAAIGDFSKVIEMNPGYAVAYNNRADTYARMGNFRKAFEDLDKSIQRDPRLLVTRINLCKFNNFAGNYRQALKECSIAIEIDRDNAEAYKCRGFSYNALGNYKEAILDYNRAVALDSGDYEAYDFRGIAVKNSGDPPAAIRDFTRAIELNPGFFDAYIVRGIAYGEIGRFEDAVHDFTVAVELRPKDASAYYNRGAAYYRQGKKEDAMSDFKKAARLGDKDIQKVLRSRGVRW